MRSSNNSAKKTFLKRSAFQRWLDRLGSRAEHDSPKRGRLLLESLESRQLLAGDVELFSTDGSDSGLDEPAAQTGSNLTVTTEAEGELVADLVAFAKALTAEGVQFFGAAWCPFCTDQKELFQDGAHFLPYIEISNPDRSFNSVAIAEGIESIPTWEFPDGTRATGVLSLATLSERSGVDIPQGETPSFVAVGNQTVQIGSPLHVPIDVYDPDGGVQTVTVSVDNPDLVSATVLSGNRSLLIDMATYGDMVFELFEQRAPRPTSRLIALAEADFYDNIGFHRIIDNFVIQTGDPLGNGTGGSTLGDFDDQYHPDLQHNRPGVLSYAKTSDDTNDSQFFITELDPRHLDFNHSVSGQLVEGDDVREAISEHQTNSAGLPSRDIVIETIEVFNDTENSVIMLKPSGNTTGSTNVTITVTDPDGNSFSETVQVDVVNDTANSQPFLNEITVPASFEINTAAQVQLSSTDVEGDAVTYFASLQAGSATVSVNPTTGLLSVTPATNFTGDVRVAVGVEPGPGVIGNAASDSDNQAITLTFEGELAPTSLDLDSGSDSGSSNVDNITNLEALTFNVTGTTAGANVEIVLVSTGAVIGSGTATGDSISITTNNIAPLNDGSFELAARQTRNGNTSALSAPITVVFDTTVPDSVIGSATLRGNVGREYQSDLISDEEGSGLRYAISSGPAGATIDAATGLIEWTPTAAQIGANTFTINVTDNAGNALTESFTVAVADVPLVGIKLRLTDLDGNDVSIVQVGQEFLMEFIAVDTRSAFDRQGVFAAFSDILFDSSLVRPVPGAVIDYEPTFPTIRDGDFFDGLIDELGAASSSLSATALQESLIATVRFEAIATGSLNFRSEPAEEDLSEVLLYGVDEKIPPDRTEFGTASLAIGQNFTINDDDLSVAEDSGANTLDVLDNDVVIQGSATLAVLSVTQPDSGGSVALTGGDVVFTPAANFNGEAVFTYRAGDGSGAQEDGTVTVTVTPVNDPPTGMDDTFDVAENSTANVLNVLLNDSDSPDSGETLTITNVTSDTAGAVVRVSPDGRTVRYDPPSDFTGTDSFTYTLSDGALTTEVQTIVTVAPADPPPTANADAFTVSEDAEETEFDVTANDETDENDQPFVLESAVADQGGSVRVTDDGRLFYAPAANFFGSEQVIYTIRDSGGGVATGTVTFTIEPSPDAPPVTNAAITLTRGGGESTVLRVSDLPANVDGDGETLTFSNLGTPTAGGVVRIDSATGDVLYTPPSDIFVGTDSFTYDVDDGSGLTSRGTRTVEIVDFVRRDIIFDADAFKSFARIDGIKLIGTDTLGNPVDTLLRYSADDARFEGILPGEYEVEIPAIPFLQNAAEAKRISVISAPDDGDMTVDPELGRLRPEYISIFDWLGSAPLQSVLAVVSPGSASLMATASPSTETIVEPRVTLDAPGESLTISGKNSAAAAIEVTLPATGDSRVQTRGRIGESLLLKINVGADDVAFTTVGPAPEAEQVAPATSNLTVNSAAEGESVAGVSQSNVLANVSARSHSTDPQATSIDEEQRLSSDASAPVDAAMQDVAKQLTIISPVAEALADDGKETAEATDLAIDAVLSDEL